MTPRQFDSPQRCEMHAVLRFQDGFKVKSCIHIIMTSIEKPRLDMIMIHAPTMTLWPHSPGPAMRFLQDAALNIMKAEASRHVPHPRFARATLLRPCFEPCRAMCTISSESEQHDWFLLSNSPLWFSSWFHDFSDDFVWFDSDYVWFRCFVSKHLISWIADLQTFWGHDSFIR